ncbi:CAP domain-containing protein [Selenomonas sp. KH1T6]|uniref:CAP domain-containing protein n=1 Tax=Selenomonas sp. KH1T6 TaxID=3158784 RepID=UPI0008A79018|nr:Cysteine-rich secretory protein family protein [Selenomonas ruminantium]
MKAAQRVFFFLVMAMVFVAATPVFASSIQSEVLYYVNVERAAAGLRPVELDSSMNSGAAVRAQEAQVNFAHQRPDGSDVKSVVNKDCGWFGENLAVSQANDAQRIVKAWMGSPTHRANILNRHYAYIGVDCQRGADGHYYWSLLFAGA